MTLIDNLMKKAEELELQAKAERLAKQAEVALTRAVERTGQATHDNRDKISTFLDKAGQTVDDRTEGKYHDKVAKLRVHVDKGLGKLAEQRPGATSGWAAGTEGSGDWSADSGSGGSAHPDADPFAPSTGDPFAGSDPFAREGTGDVWSDAQSWTGHDHVGEEAPQADADGTTGTDKPRDDWSI